MLLRPITRRQALLLGAAGALGLVAGYGWGLEPRWLRLARVKVTWRRPLPHPVRILHLADFHRSSLVPLEFIRTAIRIGLAQDPAFICLTGDFVTAGDERDLATYGQTLRLLPQHAPTYAVLGNHDGGTWSRARGGYTDTVTVRGLLEDAGIVVLENRGLPVDAGLNLVGISDLWAGPIDPTTAFASVPTSSAGTIVLAHNPDTKDVLRDHAWDLMLSGHTHGGQVVLPLVGAPFAPVRDRRFVAGLNSWGERRIHTTRGVGNLYGVRINCRPEVSVLEIS